MKFRLIKAAILTCVIMGVWSGTAFTAQAAERNETKIPLDHISYSDAIIVETLSHESKYEGLAIADVTNYVNVRTEPNTESAIAGKMYDGAVAQVLAVTGAQNDWFRIVSGNVEGYVKAEFFLYGEDALAVIEDYVTYYAVVKADRLNVREQPGTDSRKIGYIDNGGKVKILEDAGEWLKVQYTDSTAGYVAAEYVTVTEDFEYAMTLEEETKELRGEIVNFAMQYLGYRYVNGGQTLEGGTDCSGFTSLIYAEFGYSLGRTPAGQLSGAGRSIDYSEIQPGDIICYGSSGTCTHVALYIGDGQIIHAANSRKGVIIGQADYDTILGVKNIID